MNCYPKCHRCGLSGHKARECSGGSSGGPVKCFSCGGPHFARECPKKAASSSSSRCFRCGGDHFARDCPERDAKDKCFRCGGPHFVRECPKKAKDDGGKCFRCGGDHFARDCPDAKPDATKCMVCLEEPRQWLLQPCGHLATCSACTEKLEGICPVCRASIESTIKAFVV